MATLYIDIEELELERTTAPALVEKIKAAIVAEHPNVTIEINGDSEFDNEPEEVADEVEGSDQ